MSNSIKDTDHGGTTRTADRPTDGWDGLPGRGLPGPDTGLPGPRLPRWPAVALILAAVISLVAEWLVASAWNLRPYSYVSDYIAFLGSPDAGAFDGVVISSPLWFVMDAAWIISGLLVAVAAVRLAMALSGWRRVTVVVLAVVQAVGLALFALFPLGPSTVSAGLLGVYLVGAFSSIGAGNALAVVVGLSAGRLGLPRWVAVAGIALGAVGLSNIPATYGWLAIGVAERISTYSFLAWQLITGLSLWRSRPRGR